MGRWYAATHPTELVWEAWVKKSSETSVKIEKNVPIPNHRGSRYGDLPFEHLQVGESFFVPYPSGETNKQVLFNFQAGISGHSKTVGLRMNRKFTTRKVPDGVRVWRMY
jgi:hypothetical protein